MSKHHVRLVFIVAGLAALITAVAPSLAAPKPHNSTPASPALTGVVDQSAGTYTTTGTGFKPGELIVLNLGEADGCCSSLNVAADTSGAFTFTRNLSGFGAYNVRAAELVRGNWTFVAEWNSAVY
jgi:hypothetical protein